MKKLFTVVFIILPITAFSRGDMSNVVLQVLDQANIKISDLEANGQRLLMGEFTGAGKISVRQINAFITNRELIYKNEVREITFKNANLSKTVKNIKSIQIDERVFDIQKIKGIIVD